MRPSLLVALLAASVAHATATAFDFRVTAPEFTVAVPALPNLAVEEVATTVRGGGRQFQGSNGTYSLEILVSSATKEVTSRECAGSILRSLVARPGMPTRDNIYRAPLSEKTFLVLYVLGEKSEKALHAHLLSSASGTHCVEAHFRRSVLGGEDEDEWRKAFLGSRVE